MLGTTQAIAAATTLAPYPTDIYRSTDHLAALIERYAKLGSLVRAAIDGVGLAFVSDERVAHELTSGELVRVLDDWCQPFPGFFLYYPSRRQQPAALAALITALRL